MTIQEIKQVPTSIDKIHESCFRSYHILNKVFEMLRREDSLETIEELVEYLNKTPIEK